MTREFYDTHAEQFINGTIDIDMSSVYLRFEEKIKRGSKLLDVGFGSGRDSLYFMKKGYDVVSIDNSDEIVRRGKIILHSEVLQVDVRDMAYRNEFDAIWACATLVHLTQLEFKDVLKRLEQALKSEGAIYVSARAGTFEGDVKGRYMNYMNHQRLHDALDGLDLDVIDEWTEKDLREGFDDLNWFNVILRKK